MSRLAVAGASGNAAPISFQIQQGKARKGHTMSRRLREDDSVWMYDDEDREDEEFTDEDLQNGLAQLITGDWGYGCLLYTSTR